MRYMLMIYNAPGGWEKLSEEEQNSVMSEYYDYTDSLESAGILRAGAPLESVDTATTVRVRDGERLTTDGPFAETREVLGGYYVIEVDSLDEALDHAARIPGARNGSVEVRPIVEVPARR